MTFPLIQPALPATLSLVQGTVASIISRAQNALATLQSGNVNAIFVANLLGQLNAAIAALSATNTTGLNAYATANIPGYVGTMSTDIATIVTALQACLTWVVTNYPQGGGFLQDTSINAQGVITLRTFTPAQTLGLQTALQAVISSAA